MQRPSVNISKLMQWLCICIQFFIVINAIIITIVLLFSGKMADIATESGKMTFTYNVGHFPMKLPDGVYDLAVKNDSESQQLKIEALKGKILIQEPEVTRSILKRTLPATLFTFLTTLVLAYIVTNLFRKLFRNVSEGTPFLPENFQYLQKIGLTIIVASILVTSCYAWYQGTAAEWIVENLAFTTLELDLNAFDEQNIDYKEGTKFFFRVQWAGVFVGAMFLALGEAFRQGALLKQENDLTI